MAQISQNADGTYSKGYSDTEIEIIRSLQEEVKMRIEGDQTLWTQLSSAENRLTELEDGEQNLADIQATITSNIQKLNEHENRIQVLETSVIVDAYSKKEMDAYMVEWKIEEIAHVFDTPTNEMFDKSSIDDLQSGYVHFYKADIREPYDHHFPENSMRRYTISAYAATPKRATFLIHFADRLRIYADETEVAAFVDSGGNFGGTAKSVSINLKEGWTKIQFLVSNETQQGGLSFSSDLYDQADYLSNLDYIKGMISGNRIQPGTLDESHFSPNMDLVVRTIKATASNEPGFIAGDPNGCGIIQIADKTISKCKDEPFVFDDGIRVNGFIRVSQLLIDNDFLRAGKGIMVSKIKDAETGFTKMYEIINDMRLTNGGGLVIAGNAQDGYTVTNDLQLKANPGGGIEITGNPINGYMVTNIMKLISEGGLQVRGDATSGYYIRNMMALTASAGLKVEGNAWEGYHLKNQMELTGDGVRLTPTVIDGDAISSWHIENDTKIDALNGIRVVEKGPEAGHFSIANILEITGKQIRVQPTGNVSNGFSKYHLINDTIIEEDCGIDVIKVDDGHFRIKNALSLRASGSTRITGDVCSGYQIEGLWPTINAGTGIRVINSSPGIYMIENTGVTSINTGNGIKVNQSTGAVTVTNNGVVGLTGSGMAQVTGSPGGTYNVHVPQVEQINVVGGTDISVSKSGNTYTINFTGEAAPPPPATTEPMEIIIDQLNVGQNWVQSPPYAAAGYYTYTATGEGLFWHTKVKPSADQYILKTDVRFGLARYAGQSNPPPRAETRAHVTVGGSVVSSLGSTLSSTQIMDSQSSEATTQTFTFNLSAYIGQEVDVRIYCTRDTVIKHYGTRKG